MTAQPTFAESGPGSLVGFGPRLAAFIVDGILADVLAIVANGGYHVGGRQNLYGYVAFLLIEAVFVTLAGQTPGMKVVGIGVVSLARRGRPALRWVLVRTLLIATVMPALIPDKDGRSMHDRAAGTATVRMR